MMLLFAHSILEVELAVTWYRLICGILSLLVLHRIVWHSWSSRLLWNYIVFSIFSDFLDFLKFYYLIILSPLFVCGFTLILACHLLLFLILWGRSLFLIPYKGVRLGISHIPWDGSLRDSCRLIHVRCSRDEVHWNVLYASSLIDQVLKMKVFISPSSWDLVSRSTHYPAHLGDLTFALTCLLEEITPMPCNGKSLS